MSKHQYKKVSNQVLSFFQFREISDKLHDTLQLLRGSEDQNRSASIPSSYIEVSKEEEIMDTLARILTYNETCAALCNYKGKWLIASNRKSPEYAKKYIPLFKNFCQHPFKKEYKKLYEEAIEQIQDQILAFKSKKEAFYSKKRNAENSNDEGCLEFLKSIDEENVDVVIKKCQEILLKKEEYTSFALEMAIDFFRPIMDLNIITSFIIENKIAKNQEKTIDIKEPEYLDNKLQKHAEICVIDKVQENITEKDNITIYIGIAKLSCGPCGVSVTLLKTSGYTTFKISGIHGGTYPGKDTPWLPPNSIINNPELLEKFLKQLKEYLPASYDKVPETYPFLYQSIPVSDKLLEYSGKESFYKKMSKVDDALNKNITKIEELQKEIEEAKELKNKVLNKKREELKEQNEKNFNDDKSPKQIEKELKELKFSLNLIKIIESLLEESSPFNSAKTIVKNNPDLINYEIIKNLNLSTLLNKLTIIGRTKQLLRDKLTELQNLDSDIEEKINKFEKCLREEKNVNETASKKVTISDEEDIKNTVKKLIDEKSNLKKKIHNLNLKKDQFKEWELKYTKVLNFDPITPEADSNEIQISNNESAVIFTINDTNILGENSDETN